MPGSIHVVSPVPAYGVRRARILLYTTGYIYVIWDFCHLPLWCERRDKMVRRGGEGEAKQWSGGSARRAPLSTTTKHSAMCLLCH